VADHVTQGAAREMFTMVSLKLQLFSTRYLYQRDGIYYFQRDIPVDLRHHYPTKKVAFSLRTKSQSLAQRGAATMATKLDAEWFSLRINGMVYHASKTPQSNAISSAPTLNEALEIYLRLKSGNKPPTFASGATRNVAYVVEVVGDKPISAYTTIDAGKFRDWLIQKGMVTSSLRRVLSSIKAIINLAISEHGLNIKNPFANVFLPDTGAKSKRIPVNSFDIDVIQRSCVDINDEIRWLIALISDTGVRLSEAAGLLMEDVKLDQDVPCIVIAPNVYRRLKNTGSERVVPLSGMALWAAQQVKLNSNSICLFPKYTKSGTCNANSASAAANKWIKSVVTANVSVHSFRHSMRDRLRAVSCPTEVIDQIGGWSTGSVGSKYGLGYPIEMLSEWMHKITTPS
jgi:integrase